MLVEQKNQNLENVKHKIAILSGKGGVGKSALTIMLSLIFAKNGYKVGVLDADASGPSIPKMLGLKDKNPTIENGKILPIKSEEGIKVISIEFFLKSETTPVIWRGPLKAKLINQFFSQTNWEDTDILLIDLPPGTGDEALTIAQSIKVDGAIIVTIPSEVSKFVVKKAVSFAKELNMPILGIVENMHGLICEKCNEEIEFFSGNAGEEISKELEIEFLGAIPFDPKLSKCFDRGIRIKDLDESKVSKSITKIFEKIEEKIKDNSS
jgi:ATP-binding protein involved in chromosome partitioning